MLNIEEKTGLWEEMAQIFGGQQLKTLTVMHGETNNNWQMSKMSPWKHLYQCVILVRRACGSKAGVSESDSVQLRKRSFSSCEEGRRRCRRSNRIWRIGNSDSLRLTQVNDVHIPLSIRLQQCQRFCPFFSIFITKKQNEIMLLDNKLYVKKSSK